MDMQRLKMDLDYRRRLAKYNEDARLLKEQREQFYKDNPDFPFEYMYIQVAAPPQKIEFRRI